MKNDMYYKAFIYKASKAQQTIKARAIADNDIMLQELNEALKALIVLMSAIALEEEREKNYE